MTASLKFCSRLGVVNLFVFSLYIVNLDKQLYVELETNQYRCLVSLVWRCQSFVLAQVHCIVDITVGVCLFLSCYNIYLAFRPLQPIIIHYPNTVHLTTGLSIGHLITAWPSSVTHSTGLIQISCLLQVS